MGFLSRTVSWEEYRLDILGFCEVLFREPWEPSEAARTFLLGVQRGYSRIGCARAPDGWKAMAAACLWMACCQPDRLQLVMAGTQKSGQMWVRYLKQVTAEGADQIRKNLLFSEDEMRVFVARDDEPVLTVLTPGLLAAAVVPRLPDGRATALVMPDLDRVRTEWFERLRNFVSGPNDQWLTVAPIRP